MKRLITKLLKKLHLYKRKGNSTIALIGEGKHSIKVCDIINGKPHVTQNEYGDTIEFVLRYSLFRKEVKRYDRNTFKEIIKH